MLLKSIPVPPLLSMDSRSAGRSEWLLQMGMMCEQGCRLSSTAPLDCPVRTTPAGFRSPASSKYFRGEPLYSRFRSFQFGRSSAFHKLPDNAQVLFCVLSGWPGPALCRIYAAHCSG